MGDEAKNRVFGDTLRAARKGRNLTLGELAKQLELTVGYLSDVERGKSNPLDPALIERAIGVVGAEWRDRLLETAVLARGALTLQLSETREDQRAMAAALMRRWSTLTEADIARILGVLK